MPGYRVPGSDAVQKIMECLKTVARSSSSLLTITEGITSAGTVTAADLAMPSTGTKRPIKVKKVALAAVGTAGGVFAFTPGVAGYVHLVVLNITTLTSAACTVDVGVATDETTLSDSLIDGANVAASTGVSSGIFTNIANAGSNGKTIKLFTSTQAITGSVASGAATAIAGYAYIHYVEL